MFSRDDPTARIGDARRHRPLVRVNSNNVARAVGRDQHARRTRPPSPAGHICSTLHWYGYGGPGRQRPGGDRRFARSTLLSGQTGSRKHGPRSTLLTQDTTKGSRHYSGQTPVRLSTLTRTVARVRANPISTPGHYGPGGRLDLPSLVDAARQTARTGAAEFCIVAAVRGPDERLMAEVRAGVQAIHEAVEINVACSLGILTPAQAEELAALGVHRYNHNLETARSYFPEVVTTHTWEERWETLRLVREHGMEVCCGAIVGMGESLEQRAELAAQLGDLGPDEVPLNFLDPRPGTPFAALEPLDSREALLTIAAFRFELPLGDLGARQGMLGGINAVIVGNYLTTLGRDPAEDLELLADLAMPVKALSATLWRVTSTARVAGRPAPAATFARVEPDERQPTRRGSASRVAASS